MVGADGQPVSSGVVIASRSASAGAAASACDFWRIEAHPSASRIVVGRGRDESAVVSLADGEGRTRLRLIVGPQGDPRIELLDAAGEVVDSMPRRESAVP